MLAIKKKILIRNLTLQDPGNMYLEAVFGYLKLANEMKKPKIKWRNVSSNNIQNVSVLNKKINCNGKF